MKTPLELVKSKVQEACADVMNLEFGCEVFCEQAIEDENGGDHDLYGIFIRQTNDDECEVLVNVVSDDLPDGRTEMLIPYTIKNLEILGREIRLAEILRTIEKNSKSLILVSANGRFHRKTKEGFDELFDWNLEEDSLSWHAENRPDVILLLAEVLK